MRVDTSFCVQACICYARTFADLKRLAEEQRLETVNEITEATGCGSGCGLCRPYIARMLKTGETAFPVLPQEDD